MPDIINIRLSNITPWIVIISNPMWIYYQYIKYVDLLIILWIINTKSCFLLVRSCEDCKSFLLQLDNLECLSVTLKIPTCMFPYHYVAATCCRQGSRRLKLENGLAVLTYTAIKILQDGKLISVQLGIWKNIMFLVSSLIPNKLKIMTNKAST